MVKLGWMQDSHINDSGISDRSGVDGAITTDIDTLGNTYGVEDIYWTGDQVAPANSGSVPHVDDADFERFWNLVDNATYSDLVRYAIPGNHDTPIQNHLKSDDRAILRARVDYDSEGVTVLLVNTHANGYVSGSPGTTGGTGQTTPNMPYRDLKWLDEQLEDAGNNAKLILPHAGLFAIDSGITFPTTVDTNPTRRVLKNKRGEYYEFVENFNQVHATIQKYDKVVVPVSHLFQQGSGSRGKETVDGVEYVHKNHYWNSNANDASTFGFIDISGSGATVKTVEHSDGTEYTLLDKAF